MSVLKNEGTCHRCRGKLYAGQEVDWVEVGGLKPNGKPKVQPAHPGSCPSTPASPGTPPGSPGSPAPSASSPPSQHSQLAWSKMHVTVNRNGEDPGDFITISLEETWEGNIPVVHRTEQIKALREKAWELAERK